MIKISFFLLYTYPLNRALSTLKGLDCTLDLQKPDLVEVCKISTSPGTPYKSVNFLVRHRKNKRLIFSPFIVDISSLRGPFFCSGEERYSIFMRQIRDAIKGMLLIKPGDTVTSDESS